jgi:hypothetical protein
MQAGRDGCSPVLADLVHLVDRQCGAGAEALRACSAPQFPPPGGPDRGLP